MPATGSVAALISRATGVEPYYVGKPNPLMMRSALNAIDAHSERTAMIGDRMDTDIVSGLEAGLKTVLVLSGVATRAAAERHPFRPSLIVDSVADLIDDLGLVLLVVDGPLQLRLVHPRAALDTELLRFVVELVARAPLRA